MANDQQEMIDTLLMEFKEQRDNVKLMLVDIERLREKVDQLLPDTIDKRYLHLFEEKIKTITELFKLLMDMRKEISRSIKDEIDMRKKLTSDDSFNIEDMLDIRGMVKHMENLKKRSDKVENQVEENITN